MEAAGEMKGDQIKCGRKKKGVGGRRWWRKGCKGKEMVDSEGGEGTSC